MRIHMFCVVPGVAVAWFGSTLLVGRLMRALTRAAVSGDEMVRVDAAVLTRAYVGVAWWNERRPNVCTSERCIRTPV